MKRKMLVISCDNIVIVFTALTSIIYIGIYDIEILILTGNGLGGKRETPPPERKKATEVFIMTTKTKVAIVLGTAALAAAAYGGYRYWRAHSKARTS